MPYRDLRRPAITRWEQLEAQRTLRERGRGAVNEQLIFDAVETQRFIVAEAARKTKAARLAMQRTATALADAQRVRAAKHSDLPKRAQPAPVSGQCPPPAPPLGDLPFLVDEKRG